MINYKIASILADHGSLAEPPPQYFPTTLSAASLPLLAFWTLYLSYIFIRASYSPEQYCPIKLEEIFEEWHKKEY